MIFLQIEGFFIRFYLSLDRFFWEKNNLII